MFAASFAFIGGVFLLTADDSYGPLAKHLTMVLLILMVIATAAAFFVAWTGRPRFLFPPAIRKE